ncbi:MULTISPECIES: DUF6082 family protein [unclassified Streptomyces]|uniref:DUF6082 family protein n=1 Tax=unclassified Streptomyces TaxID=2593676 RepID=UPI00278C4C0F|nr:MULTISPECIES: DUF6082 family protein [unclassified Streptomyces]
MATLKQALGGIGVRLRSGALGRGRRKEELLAQLVEEVRRSNVLRQHTLFIEQLDRAINDPDYAATLSTLPGLSVQERRRMLIANREYAVNLLACRVGAYTWDELIGHLRVLCRNEVFQLYWGRTVEHRRSVAPHSLDARARDAVDLIIEELAADPDEWWVVGPD